MFLYKFQCIIIAQNMNKKSAFYLVINLFNNVRDLWLLL